jgi:hypothetical protein
LTTLSAVVRTSFFLQAATDSKLETVNSRQQNLMNKEPFST